MDNTQIVEKKAELPVAVDATYGGAYDVKAKKFVGIVTYCNRKLGVSFGKMSELRANCDKAQVKVHAVAYEKAKASRAIFCKQFTAVLVTQGDVNFNVKETYRTRLNKVTNKREVVRLSGWNIAARIQSDQTKVSKDVQIANLQAQVDALKKGALPA